MRTTIPQPPPPPPPPPSTTTTAATTTAPTITTCPSTSPHATRAAHLTGLTSLHFTSPRRLTTNPLICSSDSESPFRTPCSFRIGQYHQPVWHLITRHYTCLSHLARRSTPTSATSRALRIPTADQISLGISLPPPRISLASPLCSLRQYLNSSPLYSR